MIAAGTLLDDRYRLEARLGSGGAGEVWRARHITLDSVVAIKVLHVIASHKKVARKRFLQEARVTAQLRIRQAVQVHDFGFAGERPYLVMELLEGETLKTLLAKRGRLPLRETAIVLRQAARALERAHTLGIIHRDFKPDNIFVLLDEDGEPDVRVVDFGIAKLLGGFDNPEDEADDEGQPSDRDHLLHFTRTGGVLGTPYYMAPEQVQSNPALGPEVDVWGFGVVAYECLTGKRPFDGENAGKLFKAILESDHVPAHERVPEIPPSFSDWFLTACAPNPQKRFPDMRTAVSALETSIGIVPVLGPSWLETTDTSITKPTTQNPVDLKGAVSHSLSGTASAVKRKKSRRLIALGALLLSGAMAMGFLAARGTKKPDHAISDYESPASLAVDAVATTMDTSPISLPASAVTASPAASPAASATVSASVSHSQSAEPEKPPPVRRPTTTAKPTRPTSAPELPPAPQPEPQPKPDPEEKKPKPPSPLNLPPLGL